MSPVRSFSPIRSLSVSPAQILQVQSGPSVSPAQILQSSQVPQLQVQILQSTIRSLSVSPAQILQSSQVLQSKSSPDPSIQSDPSQSVQSGPSVKVQSRSFSPVRSLSESSQVLQSVQSDPSVSPVGHASACSRAGKKKPGLYRNKILWKNGQSFAPKKA